MDFENIRKTMTKEEFLDNKKLTNRSGCPSMYKLKDFKRKKICIDECRECWKLAIEKGNIKFKDDKTEELNVINALKVVQNYCEHKQSCQECTFGVKEGICEISESLGYGWSPNRYKPERLENLLKPKVNIYEVEHSKNGKLYDFVSDEELSISDMVYCNTRYGHTYGKIIEIRKGTDEGYKKCWEVK
ncbi:hypothetical protein [Clostridium botulinum]|uniref:hypothetical protein n=1 Tax=Clostridium botulinum TaxID=1491 RepID=UPI000774DC35|nr:hypothetical protein [Clostridium botulinum]MBY6932119.1 hypothetical protein [Clostridium botulinum]NFG20328.1 hypothetical protein [Clostridium botulinum]NFO82481.1 hypothetical protein [Clostridium botulinum]